MTRKNLDKNYIIKIAVQLANDKGIESVTLKTLADELGIKSPSLYNHVGGIDGLRKGIILYGWNDLEKRVMQYAVGISGYDALKAVCRAYYGFAIENTGVFQAMLWYNKFRDDEIIEAETNLFSVFFRITASLNISKENGIHMIRALRSFMDGFILWADGDTFGDQVPTEESFEVSLNILIAGMKQYEE